MAKSAALSATLYTDDGDSRRAPRRDIRQASTLRDPSLRPLDVLVHDLSVSGLRLTCPVPLELGSIVRIGLPAIGPAKARIVRRDGNDYGCDFVQPISESAVAGAFRGDPVVPIGTVPLPTGEEAFPEPQVERWPGALRVGFIFGASSLLWLAIVGPWLIWAA